MVMMVEPPKKITGEVVAVVPEKEHNLHNQELVVMDHPMFSHMVPQVQ
tara:strand:+ start:73 stop:216 length:144 start_codon:yes stop_codon:yes gene_type:complete